MTKRRTLHPSAEQGMRKANCVSDVDYTLAGSVGRRILDLLPRGEENALPSRDLAKLVGCKSVRDLQSLIADERDAGNLILSTCRHGGGYFQPADGEQGQQEIAAFIRTLRARALNTLSAIKTARKALKSVPGQLDIGSLEGV